jgi:DNA polymerase-3 subunit delta
LLDVSELEPVYLIAGSDRPKVDRAVERLRARFLPEAVELLAAGELGGDAAVASCNALGLFGGGGRLVVVEGVESWKADDVKAVGAYLRAPAPETTLALVAGELSKDAPLAKAVAAAKGEVLLWDVPKRSLQGWVAEQFRLQGARAEPEACRALLELVGEEMYDLASEVDKLATWAAGQPIGAAEVEELVAARAETTNFALTDAFGGRDLPALLGCSERLLERSGDPHSRSISRIVSMLANHVSRLRSVKRLEADGVSSRDAASRLKQHPFYVGKLYQQSRNYSAQELDGATVRLAELDHALKGGSHLGAELELERTLVGLAAPASGAADHGSAQQLARR